MINDSAARLTAIAAMFDQLPADDSVDVEIGDLRWVLAHVETLENRIKELEATIEGMNASEDMENHG